MVSSSATTSDKNDNSSEEEDTTKTKRGRTLLAKVMRQKDKGQNFKLVWNGKGQTIRTNNANFKSYTGVCTRSRVSINYRSWNKVPDHIKESIWTDVSGVYDVPDDKKEWLLSTASCMWRSFKSKLGSKFIYDREKNVNPHPLSQYTFINQKMWDIFIAYRQTKGFKEESDKHREIASNNAYPYRGSRKGYLGIEDDMITEAQEEENSTEDALATSSSMTVDRHHLWKKARTTKDGNMDECVKEIVEKNGNMMTHKLYSFI